MHILEVIQLIANSSNGASITMAVYFSEAAVPRQMFAF